MVFLYGSIYAHCRHLESFHKLVTNLSDALQGLQLIAVSDFDCVWKCFLFENEYHEHC